jgi:glycosyltransferase involved in cell wall biosynthesis
MNKTLLVQTIFCPTRGMLDIQLSSMRSLSNYLRLHSIQADIYFAGFVDADCFGELTENIKRNFPAHKCAFIRFDKNYGKAFAVNEAVRKALQRNAHYKYLLTFDSDICFESKEPDLLSRLIRLSEKTSDALGRPFGLIACNFTGDNVHWLDKFENRKRIDDEVISWPSQPGYPGGGIAGGCIFVGMDSWLKVGGYRTVGVYAPDDGYLMIDMCAAGYYICVAETIFVHHPRSNVDSDYSRWKREAIRQFSVRLQEGSVVDFADDVRRCEVFWARTKLIENQE